MEDTILDRRDRMLRIARQHGFQIRTAMFTDDRRADSASNREPLMGCTWCEIRGRRVIFIDNTQTAAEKILGIKEVLETTAHIRPRRSSTGGVQPSGKTSNKGKPKTKPRSRYRDLPKSTTPGEPSPKASPSTVRNWVAEADRGD